MISAVMLTGENNPALARDTMFSVLMIVLNGMLGYEKSASIAKEALKTGGSVYELALEKDQRGNVLADTIAYKTSMEKVFSAGDMRRGQSLVVWAIREGRQAARSVDEYLMGETTLPR